MKNWLIQHAYQPFSLQLRPVFSNEGSHNFVLLNRRMNNIISDGFIVDESRNQITFNQFQGVQRERESLFFQLPAKFRGDRVTSYGGYLRFTLEFTARPEGRMSRDVDLEIIVSFLILSNMQTYIDILQWVTFENIVTK